MSRVVSPFIPPPSELPRQAPRLPVRKFTVEEYHKLITAGFFDANERFELLEGWIVPKMSRNPPHDVAIDKAAEAIGDRLPDGWRVRVQSAITTADSEVEPDLAIVRGPADRYLTHHPYPHEIAFVVESSASSLGLDRADKGRVYAAAGIPIYWILNVEEHLVELYTDPTGPAAAAHYNSQEIFNTGDLLPLVVDGQRIADLAARDLLP